MATSGEKRKGKAQGKPAKSETKRKPTILLVEDDTFLSGMYVSKLDLEGFNVLLASDGEDGERQAIAQKPDLIILDIKLPKKDGLDVLESIKRHPQAKMIPVILLTNYSEKEFIQRGFALGAATYLIKAHFMPSEVIAKIKRILKGERAD